MRPKFRARELWLFAPFLLIGALAFFWSRREKAVPPNASGLSISRIKVEEAPGYWREKGYSHRVRVTLAHRFPRPDWWGECCKSSARNDALHPQRFPDLHGELASETAVLGGALTIGAGAQTREWPAPQTPAPTNYTFADGVYQFDSYVKLSAVPRAAGAVTFHGLVNLADSSNLIFDRQVRAPGQTFTMNSDRSNGLKIERADTTPFFHVIAPFKGQPKSGQDKLQIGVVVRDTMFDADAPAAAEAVEFYDIELHDASGTIYPPPPGGMNPPPAGGKSFDYFRATKDDERDLTFDLWLNRNFIGPDLLWMRGKISLDKRWPLVFDFPLPARSHAVAAVAAGDAYSIPLWRNGAPVKR